MEIRNRKDKNAFLDSIMHDPNAIVINETDGHKTTLFPGNKGPKTIADFKYCVTTKANTLAKDLEHGFRQANTIVLKLEKMDAGLFKEAIDYLLRNEIPYGNIILINAYGKVIELPRQDLKTGIFKKVIKGFL